MFLKCIMNILTYRVERDLSHLLDMASIQRRTRPFQINSNNQIVQMFKSFKSFQSLRYPNFVVTMRSDALIQLQHFFQDFLVFFARPLFMYYSIPYYHDSKSHQVWTSHLLVTFYIWKTLLETLLALSGKKTREGTVSDFFVAEERTTEKSKMAKNSFPFSVLLQRTSERSTVLRACHRVCRSDTSSTWLLSFFR